MNLRHARLLLALVLLGPACGGGGGGGGGGTPGPGTPLPFDAWVLLTGNRVAAFAVGDPAGMGSPANIFGISTGSLVALARRPQNGFLYGLVFNLGTVRLYALHPPSSTAWNLGSSGSFVDGTGAAVPITGTRFSMDFDPTLDRVRVVSDTGQNFRMNPNTGAFVDGDLGQAPGTVAGLNMDGPVHGAVAAVHGLSHTNSAPNETTTSLYTISEATSSLYLQNTPIDGNQAVQAAITPAISGVHGFDLPPGVNSFPGNTPVLSGSAYVVVTLSGGATQSFATLDLATGALSGVTPIGSGGILGLAVNRAPLTPAISLSTGGKLTRFGLEDPSSTFTTTVVGGVTAGETLVGVDFRFTTGLLYALGVNPVANTATLYTVDPQIAVASAVGVASSIAFVDAVGAPVDLPDPAVIGYGIDFNPPALNRIRVVTGSGLNFRVDPTTGGPVDGDGVNPGIQPEAALNGAASGADGVASTNSVPGFNATTVYALDSATNTLYLMNPPDSGTLTQPLAVTLSGAPLDFTAATGFDIPGDVLVAASNAPATGSGFVVLTVGPFTNVYRIDLATGAATDLGRVGTGVSPEYGLAVGRR